MNSGKPGTMFYFDILPALEKLSVEKVGTLFLASMRYAQTGEVPSFDDIVLDFAWELIKPGIDRDSRRYEDKRARGDWLTYCRRCKQEVVEPMDFETWREHTDNGTLQSDTDTLPTTSPTPTTSSTPTPISTPTSNIGTDKPSTRFCPPSVEDVKTYCDEMGYHVDAESFVAFYASKGWYIGKNEMKNWKQALVSWERRDEHGNIQQRTIGQQSGNDRNWTAGFHAPDI